jgi:3-oxoacyl-[acyl-carrier protein] reductase
MTHITPDKETIVVDSCTKTSMKKTILVTAATGELGAAICNHLASQGYDLILAGRNQQKLKALQSNLQKKYPGHISTQILDFSNRSTLQTFVDAIKEPLVGIVLISGRPNLPKENLPTAQEWRNTFEETFIAPLETLRLLDQRIQDNASIVIISGITSKVYLPAHPNTNVIRLAWTGEIKNLAHFFGKRKIRVNAISPAIILTAYNQNKIQERANQGNMSYDEQLEKETSSIPLKQYGVPNDVAQLTHFLLSDSAKHITSVNIPLDGGESNAY